MFDIYEKLDNIICKYELDRHCPGYRRNSKIQKVLKKWGFEHYVYGAEQKNAVIIADRTEVDLFEWIISLKIECEYIYITKEPEDVEWSEFDNIYIMAFDGADRFVSYFEQNNIYYEWIYNILRKEGFEFSKAFYKRSELNDKENQIVKNTFKTEDWKNFFQLDLYNEDEKLRVTESESVRLQILEKCFFIALWMKNFICAERYLYRILELNCEHEYAVAWSEIRALLDEIKLRLNKRRHEDIIMHWFDAMAYGEEKNMPYLKKKIDASVKFSNAFTICPHTKAVAIWIFCKLRFLEDKGYLVRKIEKENSDLLRKIEDKGYVFKVVSGCMRYFERKCYTDHYFETYDPCSMAYWDMLNTLLLTDKPLFLLVHSMEAHTPFWCTKMCGENIYDGKKEVLRNMSIKEMDDQLAFYEEFISDNASRIYMSDHGSLGISKNKFHVLFNVWNRNMKARVVEEMFSLCDVEVALEKIVNKGIIDEACCRNFVEVQGVPAYGNRNVRDVLINKKRDIYSLGYKGVITTKYMYIHSLFGDEWLIDRTVIEDDYIFEKAPYICDKNLLPQFRDMAGSFKTDILKVSIFACMVYFYKFIKQKEKFMLAGLDSVKRILEQQLALLPERSVGIRLGGYHTRMMYFIFEDIWGDKLKCIIDKDSKCMCSGIGIPVMSLDEAINEGVQAIILSSFNNLDKLCLEAEEYKEYVKVINIYKELEEQGVVCHTDFFWEFAPDDLYEV